MESSAQLRKLAVLRLRLQEGCSLTQQDLSELLGIVKNSDVYCDDVFRHSLILAAETVCRRIWQVSQFGSSADKEHHDFAAAVLQKFGGNIRRMEFKDNDRWFGGITSHPGRNSDKTRTFSILAVCLALLQNVEDASTLQLRRTVLDELSCLYSSTNQLAYDLLNSDDRFLASISALLTIGKEIATTSTHSPNEVIMASFRQIRFDPETVLSWINNDEIGPETVTAIVKSMIDDSVVWKTIVATKASCSPPAKRFRSTVDEYDETWLVQANPPSANDIRITLHVPYVDEECPAHEVSLAFSQKSEIRTRQRSTLPGPGLNDFADLEEMLVELRLEIIKENLDCDIVPSRILPLYDALTQFTGALSDEGLDNEGHEEDSDEEQPKMILISFLCESV
ncbi:unnamed protein product [Cylicocyclus nassatus]|uniref:Uncharacterized protein n=1 Tax=Cylicocyclus nassatus TaxID=53992 RepID=A0AA36GZS0_CYLNA|nr:unnamed protein product [Cylicocyclus nassatus]